jgi:hypothetical protein
VKVFLVRILVVVAISRMKSSMAEEEKSSGRTVIGSGLIGPKRLEKSLKEEQSSNLEREEV